MATPGLITVLSILVILSPFSSLTLELETRRREGRFPPVGRVLHFSSLDVVLSHAGGLQIGFMCVRLMLLLASAQLLQGGGVSPFDPYTTNVLKAPLEVVSFLTGPR